MAISNTVLTTTISNVYVSTGDTVISVMYFCNTDYVAQTFDLYAAPANTSIVDNTVQIYKNIQIAGGDTFVVDMEKLALANGDTIRGNASIDGAITTTISYVRL